MSEKFAPNRPPRGAQNAPLNIEYSGAPTCEHMPTGLRHVTTPQTCPRNTAKRLRRFSVHFPWSVFTPKSPPVGGLWGGGGGVDRLSQSKMGPAPRSVSIGLPKIRPIFCGTIFGPMVFWGFWRALCNIFTRIHATTMQAITKFHRFTTDRKFGRSPKLAKIGPGDILVTNSVITESPPKMTPAPLGLNRSPPFFK